MPAAVNLREGTQGRPTIATITGWNGSERALCIALATPSGDQSYVLAQQQSSDEFRSVFEQIEATRPAGSPLVVGVDFPLGLPSRFAKAVGFDGYRSALRTIQDASEWASFFTPTDDPTLQQPYAPLSEREVGHALHMAVDECLVRRTERKTTTRQRARSQFCLLQAKRIARCAPQGVKALLPVLDRVHLWPFDGVFSSLAIGESTTVLEVFPLEALVGLAIALGPKTSNNKNTQRDRASVADALCERATENGLLLTDEQVAAVKAGFQSEFECDAFVTLLHLLKVIPTGGLSEPEGEFRSVEGWIAGQPFPESRPDRESRAHLSEARLRSERYFVHRIVFQTEQGPTPLDLAYPTDENRGAVNVISGVNGSGKSFVLNQLERLLRKKPHNLDIAVEPEFTGRPRVLFFGKGWVAKDEIGIINLEQRESGLAVAAKFGEYRRIGLAFLAAQMAPYLKDVQPAEAAGKLIEAGVRDQIAQRFEVERVAYHCNARDPLVMRLEKLLGARLYFRCTKRKLPGSAWSFEFVLVDRHGMTIPFADWSDGQRMCFYVLISLQYFNPDIVLFDEIENHLHPAFMSEVLEALRATPAQSIVATHHPHLIFSRFADRVFYLETERPGPDPNPADEVVYSSRHADKGFRRTISRLEDDFDRVGTAYKLFSQVDEQLLRQAGYLESRTTLMLVEALGALSSHPPVSGTKRSVPDTQSMQLAEHLKAFARLNQRQTIEILDLGAGLGRQISELSKLSEWQLGGQIAWTCYEPFAPSLEKLTTRFAQDPNVTCIASLKEVDGRKFDFCVLANVLHELTPTEFADFLVAADRHANHTIGGVIVLELFPLLKPEGHAVPYDAATMEDVLTCSGLTASALQLGLRSEVSAYCVLARRLASPLTATGVISCVEAAWDRLLTRTLSAYAVGTSTTSVADHLRILSYLTTVTSISSWRAQMWRPRVDAAG